MKKTFLIILCTIFLILLCLEVQKTYSLFETNGTAVAGEPLAKWQIKVNNTYLTTLTEDRNTFSLGSINWENQGHVKTGKAAPGSVGKFYIEIDPCQTEVSFLYEITLDLSKLENSEFQISEVKEVNGKNLIRTGEYTYVGIIPLTEIQANTKHKVEVSVVWNNKEENNEADYELGSRADLEIDIPVTVVARQYDGTENFTEYNEGSV
ncbi:MAG: hypothetical protein MR598_02360 [Erysipelotrichaceae bacterium]|nr:hypothetical protein [Erysipelotrichaceae bacterium]